MDKMSFMRGYLRKTAAPVPLWEKLVGGIGYPIVLPSLAGYTAGRFTGGVMEPPADALNQLQADYVQMKMEQAIVDLENKRKEERMKQEHAGAAPSLRI